MPGRPKHILLIEDDPQTADLIQLMIGKCMLNAKVVVSAQEEPALTYIASGSPAFKLILLDLCLPDQSDGLQVLASLKSYFKINKKTPIPIVVLTNSSEKDDVKSCYELGANAYMIKPDHYQGWQELCTLLKTYWFDTITLPR